jgi:DNA-binding LytR/AlgR family response regulator
MPGVNGAELARLAQSRRTALPIVFVTGYVDLHRSARLERNECHEVFVSDKLVNTVRAALANAGRGYSDKIVQLKR